MALLAWGITLLVYRFFHYGFSSGFVLWFDHWFLILSGLSFLLKSKKFQTALTYLILIIQSIWAADNLFFLLIKKAGLGTTSYLFQPGLSFFEFVLLQSHFILPAILLYRLQKEEKAKPIPVKILAFPAVIFFFSYFAPAQNDLNCIHSSCSPLNIHVPHWLFSTLFALVVCVLLYFLSEISRRAFNKFFIEKRLKFFSLLWAGFGVLCILWNIARYRSLPHFDCKSSENDDAEISCKYTTDSSEEYFRLHYTIFIKGKTRKECTPYLTINNTKEKMESPLLLPPKEINTFSILVPFPKESLVGTLSIECHDFSY